MKKLFIIFLTLTLIFPFAVSHIMADEEKIIFTDEAEFLSAIGILNEDIDMEAIVTRAEFTAYLLKIFHLDLDFTSDSHENIFVDVSCSHEYYAQIKACRNLNIISGSVQSQFRPGDAVTVNEAVTMLVNGLGYTQYANSKGGYPTGYTMVASEIGILKSISLGTDCNFNTIIKMLYNTLFADIVTYDSISDGNVKVKIESGKNILSERMSITKGDYIVVDNGITALSGSSMSDTQRIVLSDYKTGQKITAFKGNTDIDTHLGARADVYLKNDEQTGRIEVVYYKLNKNSKELIVNCDDIVMIDNRYLEYEDNAGKIKKASFDSGNPIIIYNGIHIFEYDHNIFKPNDGVLNLLDSDNDGDYEIVFIYSFNFKGGDYNSSARNITVKRIDMNKLFIIDWLDSDYKLDLNEEDYMFKFVLNSKRKSLTDLYEYDVISIAESPEKVDDKTLYYLVVSENKTEGIIDAVGNKEIIIGNKAYPVSDSILSKKPAYLANIDYNTLVRAYMDITGKITYISGLSEESDRNYAYLIQTGLTGSFEPVGVVKLLLVGSEIKTFNLAEKFTFNKSGDFIDHEDAVTTLQNGGDKIITYDLNSKGEIENINFAQPSSGDLLKDQDNFTLSHILNYPNGVWGYNTLDGVGIIDTIVFKIYKGLTSGKFNEKFSSSKVNGYDGIDSSMLFKYVEFYDIGLNGNAKVALEINTINDSASTIEGKFNGDLPRAVSVFQKAVKAVNEEGEVVDKIYCVESPYASQKVEGFYVDETTQVASLNGAVNIIDLKFGDLFVMEKDISRTITKYGVLYSQDREGERQGIIYSHGNPTATFTSSTMLYRGTFAYADDRVYTVKMIIPDPLEASKTKVMLYPFKKMPYSTLIKLNRTSKTVTLTSIDQLDIGYNSDVEVVMYGDRDILRLGFVYED